MSNDKGYEIIEFIDPGQQSENNLSNAKSIVRLKDNCVFKIGYFVKYNGAGVPIRRFSINSNGILSVHIGDDLNSGDQWEFDKISIDMPGLQYVHLKRYSDKFIYIGNDKDGKPVFFGDFSNGSVSGLEKFLCSTCEWSDITEIFINVEKRLKVDDQVVYGFEYDGNWVEIYGIIEGFKFIVTGMSEVRNYAAALVKMTGENYCSSYAISLLRKNNS